MTILPRVALAGLATLLLACSFGTSAQAQDSTRSVGLTASIQSQQADILSPIWLGDRFVLAPSLGLLMAQNVTTQVGFSVAGRYYFNTKSVAPYFGLRAGILTSSPQVGSSSTDVFGGLLLGGEYFIHPHFSLGVEAQLNVTAAGDNSPNFANPGKLTVNTGTAAMVSFYF